MSRYGKLQFNLDYYTEVLDLDYLIDTFPEDSFTKKYKQLNEALTGLINDYRYKGRSYFESMMFITNIR